MYKRADLDFSKKYYRQIVDETLKQTEELKNRFPSIGMYTSIYNQIADIKQYILSGRITNRDEINKRYTIGTMGVKNFDQYEEYTNRLSDLQGGAKVYAISPEDIPVLIEPVTTKKEYRELMNKTIDHTQWLIENDVKMLPEVKEKLAKMEAAILGRPARNDKNYDISKFYTDAYQQLMDFKKKVIDNNIILSTYEIRSTYDWDSIDCLFFDMETDPYAQSLGELYVKSDEYFKLPEG